MPAFGQVLPPFADRARQLAAVLIHRRFVAVVIRQAQIIHLIGQLIGLENDAVEIHLSQRGQRADVFGDGATNLEQARVIHVSQAGIGAF
ncbi:hypothetical protein D3C71_1692610 [compost metagenome]